MNLLEENLKVVNVGMSAFRDSLLSQNIETVDVNWKPPCGGDIKLINAVKTIRSKNDVDAANKTASGKITDSKIYLTGIGRAIDVIPGMREGLILHAGPPVEWKNMINVMREAAACAVIYEKLAFNKEEAFSLIEEGGVEFASSGDYDAASIGAGVISASTPVWVVENTAFGNKAYCPVNEGNGSALASGAIAQETIEQLCFIRDKFMPAMRKCFDEKIDLSEIISSSLLMGDELHLNTKAASALFFTRIAPLMAKAGMEKEDLCEALLFLSKNEKLFLNIILAGAKAVLGSAKNVEGSTIITAFSSNGFEIGIKISGLKDRWFTTSAGYVSGIYLDGFAEKDAAHYMGDDALIDMISLGAVSVCASSAVTKLIGIPVNETVNYSREMYDICEDVNNLFTIPALDFDCAPSGFDLLKIVELGISPVINAEIIGKIPGTGVIGYGLMRPKVSIFEKIVLTIAEKE